MKGVVLSRFFPAKCNFCCRSVRISPCALASRAAVGSPADEVRELAAGGRMVVENDGRNR
jgi:hypothetical protein